MAQSPLTPEMKEFQRQLRRLQRIEATPWESRQRKFGRGWPFQATNIWHYAELAGLSASQAQPIISSIYATVKTIDDLLPIVPNC